MNSENPSAHPAMLRVGIVGAGRVGITLAAALGRARASLARGEGVPHEEILREFGLNR